jgi:tRNA(Ile)-lysidine synthase
MNSACPDPAAAAAAQRLAAALTRFFTPRLGRGARLCVALSGGRDSVVLLHALSRLRQSGALPISLSAVHIHHGLSPQADAWAAFCARFCEQHAVPLVCVPVAVPRDQGEGMEAAARRQRHAVFAGCDVDWLVLAHHRADQAETVLLRLLRGAGVAGIAAMRAERAQGQGPALVRPLLDVPRQVIEAYASDFGLSWVDDASNDDRHFRRNFLRHEVLPRLEEKFPGAQQSLVRAAAHCAESAQLLDELAAIDAAACRSPAGRLRLPALNALSPARARNLLRHVWLQAGFRAPDTRWIDEALKQLAQADSLSEICVSTVDGALHVYRGELYLLPPEPEPPLPPSPTLWSGEAELPWLGGTIRFVPARGAGIARRWLADGPLTLRARQGGERLQAAAKRPRRSLRNLFQEQGIPPWQRNRLPFLWRQERLVWVGGLGVDAAFACAADEDGVLPLWTPAD